MPLHTGTQVFHRNLNAATVVGNETHVLVTTVAGGSQSATRLQVLKEASNSQSQVILRVASEPMIAPSCMAQVLHGTFKG